MTYSIILLPQAIQDVDGILAWLHERSPEGAAAWFARWRDVIVSLEQSADGASEAPESVNHSEAIRQVTFKTRSGRPYRALFLIRDRGVYILHVRGPGQNLLAPDELRYPDQLN